MLAWIPLGLAVHGAFVLGADARAWQWAVVVLVGLSGGVRFGTLHEHHALGYSQAAVLLGSAVALLISDGGASSSFYLWLIALSAALPAFMPHWFGLPLGVAIAAFYLLLGLSAAEPLTDAALYGRVGLMLALAVAGSRRWSARRSLAATDRRLAQLFRSCPAAIFVFEPDGTIVLANDAAEDMFGYDPVALEGLPLSVLLPDRFHADHA